MEIVALLLAWAFALTFVAFTGKREGQKAPKPVPVRVLNRFVRKDRMHGLDR